MSSGSVRTAVKSFLESEFPDEDFIDLSAQFGELKEMLEDAGISQGAGWVGIEFLPDDEVPITVPGTNTQGKYRETGAIYLHIAARAVLGCENGIVTRGDAIREALRGQRISGVIIESVTPIAFGPGASLQFEGGYISGSFLASYQYDINL